MGYDIWLGNSRGNIYSGEHLKFDCDDDEVNYYNFSFYEMGKFDQPAQIGAVLNHLKIKTLTYVGYSQGTSQMFSALAMNHGNLRDYISKYIALAPVVRLNHSTDSLLNAIGNKLDILNNILSYFEFEWIGGATFLVDSWLI